MDKVYLLKESAKLGPTCEKLFSGVFPDGSNLVVKLHFGEPGNQTALLPADIKPITDVLMGRGIQVTLLDTPVAYESPRDTVAGYKKVAKDRGYDDLGAAIVISDQYHTYPTKNFTAEVAKELVEAENVLVISHVKGHSCAGFGGAIKNFGMGGLSKKTKGVIHDGSKPSVEPGCQSCGICASLCPAEAIAVGEKAKVDLSKCWGCSICQVNCPHHAMKPKVATFDDLLAQGASSVINHLPKNTFYINIIKNITKSCDCESDPGEIISKDVGILFSGNPVAIDAASIALINDANGGKNVFLDSNHKEPMLQVGFAAVYTGKSKEYELVLF